MNIYDKNSMLIYHGKGGQKGPNIHPKGNPISIQKRCFYVGHRIYFQFYLSLVTF